MLISSSAVNVTSASAEAMPAASSDSRLLPSASSTVQSSWSLAYRTRSGLLSMRTTLFRSSTSARASCVPVKPAPMTKIFMRAHYTKNSPVCLVPQKMDDTPPWEWYHTSRSEEKDKK